MSVVKNNVEMLLTCTIDYLVLNMTYNGALCQHRGTNHSQITRPLYFELCSRGRK